MPRLNGMGPAGMGPMTGRQLGNCEGAAGAGSGFGAGRGYGRGMGAGLGMGLGCRRGACGRGLGFGARVAPLSPEKEKEMLSNQAETLERVLDGIRKRMENIGG